MPGGDAGLGMPLDGDAGADVIVAIGSTETWRRRSNRRVVATPVAWFPAGDQTHRDPPLRAASSLGFVQKSPVPNPLGRWAGIEAPGTNFFEARFGNFSANTAVQTVSPRTFPSARRGRSEIPSAPPRGGCLKSECWDKARGQGAIAGHCAPLQLFGIRAHETVRNSVYIDW